MRRHVTQDLLSRVTSLALLKTSSKIASLCVKEWGTVSTAFPSRGRHTSGSSWSLAAASAVFGAAAALTLRDAGEDGAHCAAEVPSSTANPKGQQFLVEFKAWLVKNGCDLAAIDIRPCEQNAAAGLGVYAADPGLSEKMTLRRWKRALHAIFGSQDAALASFPLSSVVTARTIAEDKELGRQYKELLASGDVDERQLITIFLLVEQIRGPDSAWQPWISMLPQSFSTPLFYSKADLDELKGTTLYGAARVFRERLWEQWQELSPHVETLLRSRGPAVQGLSATFDDFIWAYSAFWSRSISFPEPMTTPSPSGRVAQPQEGIVPGLDFCNHSPDAVCRWSIWNPANQKGKGPPDSVALIAPRAAGLRTGDEVTIDYGGKSNEMLLLQYGFTVDSNPEDAVMILFSPGMAPSPSQDQARKEVESGVSSTQARLQLLIGRGLSPQLFFTAARLEDTPRHGSLQERLGLSEEVWESLEVMVMAPSKALAAQASLSQLDPEAASKVKLLLTGLEPLEASALVLAKLATLERLLQQKLTELEEGTGTLEKDIRLLQAADFSASLPLRNCVVYRAGQKRIARGYLARVRRELAVEEKHIRALQARKDCSRRGS